MAERDYAVGALDDLAVGALEEVEVAGVPVLLVRLEDGAVRALGARCPHFGAPLADGLLSDGRIVCPWHHACFAAATGDLLEPPAHDGLARYPVRIEAGRILVTMTSATGVRAPALTRPAPHKDPRVFAIVGAGAAGSTAAWTLRAEGFQGRIVLITAEDRLPYDRTFLSKELLMGVELPAPERLRSGAFWRDGAIELWRRRTVGRLDAQSKVVVFEDGERLAYDQALLATGAEPRRLAVPGADLPGVLTLRARADLDRLIRAAEEGQRIAVVGGSFIALEVAASLASRGIEATVVAAEEVPFAALFGERVGRALVRAHQDMGTELLLGRKVERFLGYKRLTGVLTDRGERLPADLALVAIGVAPATSMLEGVALDQDGGVPVDPFLQAADGLYAAGDIARFPEPHSGAAVRIEHWRLACQHGRQAARNMLGRAEPYRSVPFFWSAQKLALYYVGHAPGFDEVVLDGAPEDGPFIAWYIRAGRVVAALGVQRNREMCAIHELMRLRRMPSPEEVRAGCDPLRRVAQNTGPSGSV